MYSALEGCRLKVAAMSNHVNRLEEAAERFFEDKPEVAPLTGQANSQRTKYLFRVEDVIEHPATEWGIILGDAVHCLRSSLDHLTFALAHKGDERTQFPICLTEKDWVVKAPAMYWSVPKGYVAFLDKLQPYHRGDMNEARKHPLACLMALSNLDKHRAIPAIALVAHESEATIHAYEGIAKLPKIVFREGARFEKGAVVAYAKIVPDDSGLEPDMDVKIQTTFDIGFGEIKAAQSISYKPVALTMSWVAQFVVNEVFNPILDLWNEAVRAVDAGDETPSPPLP